VFEVFCSSGLLIFLFFLSEILLLGTGKTLVQPPPFMRDYLNGLGIQLDVMDTVFCSFIYCDATVG